MRHLLTTLILAAGTSHAATLECANGVVTAVAPTEALAEAACAQADAALAHFGTCALPELEPVEIRIVEALEVECLGIFNCSDRHIEILSPATLDRPETALGVWSHMPGERLAASLVVHELAHALFDQTPCPFHSCVATGEYFAYSLQIAALSPEDRAPIVARIDPDKPVEPASINALIMFMAPGVFITKVWAHFSARPDACAEWQAVLDGSVAFDHAAP